MDYPETQTAVGTQDTGQINVTENLVNIKNEQSRDTDSIGHTIHRTNKNLGNIKNGQSRDTDNIGYTRHRTNKRDRKPREH